MHKCMKEFDQKEIKVTYLLINEKPHLFLTGIMVLDASYFVGMALQKSMTWNTLATVLKDFASTLDEAKEIISILL